jgi:transcriptional regulator with XRE-family HTH domain
MYHFDPEEQALFISRFGRMLRKWREDNGWTQYTAYNWAKEAGFQAMAPSTLCVFEQGKAPKPRPESFFALGEVNRRLMAKDYTGITTRKLRDVVVDAEPLAGNDDRAWTPVDFWSCHVGLLRVPSRYR